MKKFKWNYLYVVMSSLGLIMTNHPTFAKDGITIAHDVKHDVSLPLGDIPIHTMRDWKTVVNNAITTPKGLVNVVAF